jgi:RND family efflux transporter MFP subunit
MNDSKNEMVSRLSIAPEKRNRGYGGSNALFILIVIVLLAGAFIYFFKMSTQATATAAASAQPSAATNAPAAPPKPGDAVLTVSGYVIPRERIEISPKFIGTVRTISVKKGDAVKKNDVLVTLEDDEYRARILEAEGRVKLSEANLSNAETNLRREIELAQINAQSKQALDEAERARAAAAADLQMSKGQLQLAQTYLSWCTIRAPIDGVVLAKLVNPNELVTPQSFGGAGGPRTAFLAMADLNDLQVEIDLNEADTPKVHLNQKCRVNPEAYPEKKYEAYVAEIAPEANRAKGTLQIKVQVRNPDRFLTPELSARVDFLAGGK